MSRKQFSFETKKKYVNLILEKGKDYALIEFVCEFEDRYQDYKNYKMDQRKNRLPSTRGSWLLNLWLNKYNSGDMNNLKSKTGTAKKPNSGRRKRVSINELNEDDRDLYQEILENILKEKGISNTDIQRKIREKKEEGGKSFSNHKLACEILNINRTSVYKIYEPTVKIKISPVKRLYKDGLIEWMCAMIITSDGVIGREKLYKYYKLHSSNPVSSYVFRVHFDAMDYSSSAYKRKKSTKPIEDKYSLVWVKDYIEGYFKSDYPGEVMHADIKYLFFDNNWWYLHVILETYSNSVLAWSLSRNRTANMTIDLFEEATKRVGMPPRVFHTDHGSEYANYLFKGHLEKNGTIQSMSFKGSPLSNRPSEYWFAQIQREKFDLYDYKNWKYDKVYNLINEYVVWYNNGRPQSNLKYKTPQAVLSAYGECV